MRVMSDEEYAAIGKMVMESASSGAETIVSDGPHGVTIRFSFYPASGLRYSQSYTFTPEIVAAERAPLSRDIMRRKIDQTRAAMQKGAND